LPKGAPRRLFWSRFFGGVGAHALAASGEAGAKVALQTLAAEADAAATQSGHVHLIGAGPGDPELLTLKARRLLHEADVVIYDRLVSPQILELARREARLISVGKTPGGPSWKQDDICALLVAEAATGAQVVRLKSGDPGVYGRLDEEMDALDAAGIGFSIVPGVTAAMAAAAAARVSLTRRGRNTALRILTGHDTQGFVEHDWRALALPGATAAIYMGVGAAKFLQGRLLMHGAAPETPMSVIENASTPREIILAATVGDLSERMTAAGIIGPAILFLGLAPRGALAVSQTLPFTQSTALAAGALQ
jgi:uroporphyrin-III C-methyltransferase/precorrin-2 dehydrogenase/sirohydrochlorin ferrochelatase